MGKLVDDLVLDAALDYLKNNVTRITVCSTQPTTYTEGNATYALATMTVSSTDFTKANGDVSGRKVTIAQQSNKTISTSGTAQHIALLDVTNSKLLFVTTCTSQALTAANTVTLPAWDIELSDPA